MAYNNVYRRESLPLLYNTWNGIGRKIVLLLLVLGLPLTLGVTLVDYKYNIPTIDSITLHYNYSFFCLLLIETILKV